MGSFAGPELGSVEDVIDAADAEQQPWCRRARGEPRIIEAATPPVATKETGSRRRLRVKTLGAYRAKVRPGPETAGFDLGPPATSVTA
jgi:hypothetical protein